MRKVQPDGGAAHFKIWNINWEMKTSILWQQEKCWATVLCFGQPCPNIQKRKYLRAKKLTGAGRLKLWGRNWKLEGEENMTNWIKEVGNWDVNSLGRLNCAKPGYSSYSPDTAVSDSKWQQHSYDVHGTSWCWNGTRSSPSARGRRQQPPSDIHPAAAPEQTIFSPY